MTARASTAGCCRRSRRSAARSHRPLGSHRVLPGLLQRGGVVGVRFEIRGQARGQVTDGLALLAGARPARGQADRVLPVALCLRCRAAWQPAGVCRRHARRDPLPASGAVAVSGSMVLRRSSVVPPFVVHVKPVGVPHPDHGARHVAALVLIVEPGPAAHQSRPGGHDPGTDGGGDAGGGLIGRRQKRARHGRCERAYGRCRGAWPSSRPRDTRARADREP